MKQTNWTYVLAAFTMMMLVTFLCSCKITEQIVAEDGFTYRVYRKQFMFVTLSSKRERIEITDEDFSTMLERKEQEHALEMEQNKKEHLAALQVKEEEYKLKEKTVCIWISGICIVLAALSVVAGYVTREWRWCGGLSILFCGIAAAAAVFGDFLLWWHSVSGFVIWVTAAGVTLWLFRRFSLLEWVRSKYTNTQRKVDHDER